VESSPAQQWVPPIFCGVAWRPRVCSRTRRFRGCRDSAAVAAVTPCRAASGAAFGEASEPRPTRPRFTRPLPQI
jgi:hypothetical protein